MDTIKREDAIRIAEYPQIGALTKEERVSLIMDIPSAEKLGEWIPCSERLPSEKDYIGDVVIWCTDKSIVGVGWYYESTKSWATIDDTFPPILGKVIAWMPLPPAYEGE